MVGALTIILLFAAAWLLARVAAFVALKVLVWNDRRSADHDLTKAGKMTRLKRRETQVSIIRAGITYLGFGTAAVLSVGQLIGGVDRLTAIAGASFVLILVGFAVQRVLMDIIAGLAMFIERWYSVGDTIQIPMHELQGVVEDLSLRHTRLRTLDGEVIHIHNSQIPSVRVLPGGALELGVADGEDFVGGFFADLIRERAEDGVIAHGPVTLSVDESAARSYARASALTRRTAELTPALRRVS